MKRFPSPETETEPEPPMPADLELLRDLPKLRLHVTADLPESTASAASTTSDGCNSAGRNSEAVNPEDNDIYRTPTSEESRILMPLTCPPAPVKPRLTLLCKRKLSELEFFEILHRAEVDEFFRQTDESTKRRRRIVT